MPTTRREFLLGMVASTALGPGWSPSEPTLAAAADKLATARRQAAQRRRRVIFNNDGDDIWAAGADTTERFLAERHAPLLGTQVDSIHYCTTQSFNHFTHDTQVAEVFAAKDGKFANNNLPRFLERKTDGLRMSAEFAHQHAIESIWTLRMNDIHDAWTPEFRPRWKREDSTRILSNLGEAQKFNDRRRLWSLVDFEHPDVEPRLLAIIEEVLNHYPVDGVELDFLRAPIFFRSGFLGQPATAAQLALMTRLVRRIRELVLRESLRQSKPFLLSARVPVTQALCRKIGLEIDVWLEQQLLDVLTLGGGYITFDAPIKELVKSAHQHGVPVYGCLSQSGFQYRPPRGDNRRQPVAAWFGAAARMWQDGVDGIYTFNLFPGPNADQTAYARQVLSTIGSPTAIRTKPTIFAISDAGSWMPSHYWAKDAAEFQGALPLQLKADEYVRTSLFVPESFGSAGFDVSAELRVDLTGLAAASTPEILFGSANFGPTAGGQAISNVRRYICRVPLQAIRQGANRVMIKTQAANAQLVGAELWIQR